MKLENKKKRILVTVLFVVLIIAIVIFMLLNGYIIPTKLEAEKYEVRGIDVSEYQGDIDWDKIKNQGISFAFIKSTEGSKTKDDYFEKNFEKLKNMDMLLGIYHFFSFESTGEQQAQNYIETVGNIENDDSVFIPIIDIEYYSYYKKAKPSKDWVIEELQFMLDKLESTYRVKPMIYTTMEFYDYYIDGNFSGYDIWIRDIIAKPYLENREWKFWQYTGKGKLDGYSGEEKFIDLNVFNGTKEDFNNFMENKKQEKKNNFAKEEQERIEREENTKKSIWDVLVKNIEGNTYTLETEKNEILKVTLNNDVEIINKRTNEKMNITDIKIDDKLDFENIYERKQELVLTEESKIKVVRNIQGEELKKEVLKDNYINFDLKNMARNGNNYILQGKTTDFYYINEGQSFDIEVIVNNKTTILGIAGNIEEQLKKLENNTMYITLDKKELEKGRVVATNIEGMGC